MADEPAYAAALGADLSLAAGIDYLIGEPDAVGVGIGPQVIAAFSAHTFATAHGIEEIVVGVQQANRRSWRALEKAGYTRVFAGMIESDDPSDAGPSYVYVRRR
jgi:aminoglycoside 6'-N-acetyltransferase